MLVVCVAVFVVAMVRSCSTIKVGEDIGDSGIGVDLTNRCPSPVYAKAGDSAQEARRRLEDDPISVPTGERRMIDLVANAAYEPTQYFLAYRVADGPPVVQEFHIAELERSDVQVEVASECELVVRPKA